MSRGTGIILCGSYDEAVRLGDGYVPTPIEDGVSSSWLAVPRHPSNADDVAHTLAIWRAGTSPTARASDPDTSHAAAARAAEFAGSNRMLCLHAHVYAGTRGLTGDDLERATGRPYEALGPRRPDLVRQGLLAVKTAPAGGDLKRNGKKVYVATQAGITYYQQHQRAQGAA